MKISPARITHSITSVIAACCLSLCLLANQAGATASQWWDDNGTSNPNNGTWDNVTLNWANTSAETSTKVAFTNGNFAEFTAAGTTNINTLTITVPGAVSCAGLATGLSGSIVTNLIFSGAGSISISNGVQGFYADGPGASLITFDVPLVGPGMLEQRGNGAFALVGTNTYTGGTEVTGGQVIYYYNNASFGTGAITIPSGGSGGAFVNNSSPEVALTINNNFVIAVSGLYYNFQGGIAVSGVPGTIFAGNFTLPASGTFDFEASSTAADVKEITGVVSGSGSVLALTDVGILELGGVNTYSGGTSIANPATLSIVGLGSLGSGNYAGTITNNSKFIYASSAAQTLSGVISGTGFLILSNNATLTLGSANTYTGTNVLESGTLNVTSIGDSGASSIGTGPVTLGNASLNYTGPGDSTARTFYGISGTTNYINVPPGETVSLDGPMIGAAKWTMAMTNTGTLILGGSANDPYFGMNINAGTVILNDSVGSALGSATIVGAGATLQLGSGGDGTEIYSGSTTPLTVSSGGLFDLNGQNNTVYSLSLGGTGISGSGALINSAASTSSLLTVPITLTANTTIGGSTSQGSITLPGPISGYLTSLTYAGSAELTLGGSNTYSGGTFVNNGTLDGSTPSSIPGNVTVTGTGQLELDSAYAMAPTATVNLSSSAGNMYLSYSGTEIVSALIINGVPQPYGTYGAPGSGAANQSLPNFTGSGVLSVAQTYWDANGSDALNGVNTFGGGSGSWDDVASNWWASGNSDMTWPDGNIAFFAGTAGTVTLNASVNILGLTFTTPGYAITNTDGVSTLNLEGATPTITVPTGTPTTISAVLTGGGATAGLIVSGSGTLSLTGSNNYTGGTVISSGATVNVSSISDAGIAGALETPLTLGAASQAGGNLNFNGASGITANPVTLNGTTSTLTVPSGDSLEVDNQVKAGTTTGAPLLSFNGGGTLILGGSVDDSSLTMAINQGEVIITKTSGSTAHGLGGGVSTVGTGTLGNSAELKLAGTGSSDLYSGCMVTVNSPDGVLDLNGQNDSMSTLTLTGDGPTGTGALINSATGTTCLLTNAGSGVVLAGNTAIGGGGNITLLSKVSGAFVLTNAGTGTLTLTNNNTYSGGTIINPNATVTLLTSSNAAGSGPITVNNNAVLNVGVVGNNTVLNNAISGPGTVNLVETAAENLGLGGSMSAFTGTLYCPTTPGTTAKAQILTAAVSISSAATINLAAGGTFYIAGSGVIIPCPINIYGLGNTEVYGALRLENGALVSGPVILHASTTMGNNQSGPSKLATISGVISDGGNGYGITFTAVPGTIVLSATNTFSGPMTNNMTLSSSNSLTIGGAGLLGGGNYAAALANNGVFNYGSSAAQTLSGVISGTGVLKQSGPGNLTLTGADAYTGPTVITNGSALIIGGSGSLAGGIYSGAISNYGVFAYSSSAVQTNSGIISGTGTLMQSGPGTLTLSGANTYSGATVITNDSTLALASAGTINSSASVSIAAGSTFDVSAYAVAYSSVAGTTVNASGTGTSVGTTAATIKGGASGTISVAGPVALTFKPQTFTGDTTHPALYVSQGALNLNGSGITVNNAAATQLGVGTYSLIQAAGGSISVSSPNVTVTGTGLAPNTAAGLAISGGSLNLVVSNSIVPVPVINYVTISGTNLIFSGTNGTGSGTYHVLTATNLAMPLSQWTTNATYSFNANGSFSVTNPINSTNAAGFFMLH